MNLQNRIKRLREAHPGSNPLGLQQMVEADFSHGEQHQAIYAALRALDATQSDLYTYRSLQAVYADYCIFEQYQDEGTNRLFKVSYTIAADGTATLGTPQEVRVEYVDAPARSTEAARPVHGDVVRLVETVDQRRAVERAAKTKTKESTIPVKLIAAGWNTAKTTYYSQEALSASGPAAFPIGTQMFWNHPTLQEERDRPERNLDYLAAVIASTPTFQKEGATGPGLYTDMRPAADYAPRIADIGDYIGLSIYALTAGAPGEAEGHTGRIIEQFIPDHTNTVDFVTVAGAGGEILRQYESATRAGHTIPQPPQEKPLMTDAEIIALQAENTRLAAEAATAATERDQATSEATRLRESAVAQDTAQAVAYAGEVLGAIDMPELSRARVQTVIEASQVPLTRTAEGAIDRAAIKSQVETAAVAELRYLKESAGYGTGEIRQLGNDKPAQAEATPTATTPAPVEAARANMGI